MKKFYLSVNTAAYNLLVFSDTYSQSQINTAFRSSPSPHQASPLFPTPKSRPQHLLLNIPSKLPPAAEISTSAQHAASQTYHTTETHAAAPYRPSYPEPPLPHVPPSPAPSRNQNVKSVLAITNLASRYAVLFPAQAREPTENGLKAAYMRLSVSGSPFSSSHRSGRKINGSAKYASLWWSAYVHTPTCVPCGITWPSTIHGSRACSSGGSSRHSVPVMGGDMRRALSMQARR